MPMTDKKRRRAKENMPMTDKKRRRATENMPKSDRKKAKNEQKKTHEKIFLLFHAPYILGL